MKYEIGQLVRIKSYWFNFYSLDVDEDYVMHNGRIVPFQNSDNFRGNKKIAIKEVFFVWQKRK